MMVFFLPEVRQYLRELVEILYEKGYFGFEESAIRYVRELIFDIRDTLPTRPAKKAPPRFNRYGEHLYYATFRKSKATQWYVFFTRYRVNGEIHYLVRYISNNHMISQYL